TNVAEVQLDRCLDHHVFSRVCDRECHFERFNCLRITLPRGVMQYNVVVCVRRPLPVADALEGLETEPQADDRSVPVTQRRCDNSLVELDHSEQPPVSARFRVKGCLCVQSLSVLQLTATLRDSSETVERMCLTVDVVEPLGHGETAIEEPVRRGCVSSFAQNPALPSERVGGHGRIPFILHQRERVVVVRQRSVRIAVTLSCLGLVDELSCACAQLIEGCRWKAHILRVHGAPQVLMRM